MPAYDSFLFKPPAPVAFVSILNPKNNLERSRIPMILDTGADLTLVPKFAIENLELSQFSEFNLEGFDGKKSIVQGVKLRLNFANQKIQGNFPLIEQNYGIIGRNILNRFTIIFDGQNLEWKILQNPK